MIDLVRDRGKHLNSYASDEYGDRGSLMITVGSGESVAIAVMAWISRLVSGTRVSHRSMKLAVATQQPYDRGNPKNKLPSFSQRVI